MEVEAQNAVPIFGTKEEMLRSSPALTLMLSETYFDFYFFEYLEFPNNIRSIFEEEYQHMVRCPKVIDPDYLKKILKKPGLTILAFTKINSPVPRMVAFSIATFEKSQKRVEIELTCADEILFARLNEEDSTFENTSVNTKVGLYLRCLVVKYFTDQGIHSFSNIAIDKNLALYYSDYGFRLATPEGTGENIRARACELKDPLTEEHEDLQSRGEFNLTNLTKLLAKYSVSETAIPMKYCAANAESFCFEAREEYEERMAVLDEIYLEAEVDYLASTQFAPELPGTLCLTGGIKDNMLFDGRALILFEESLLSETEAYRNKRLAVPTLFPANYWRSFIPGTYQVPFDDSSITSDPAVFSKDQSTAILFCKNGVVLLVQRENLPKEDFVEALQSFTSSDLVILSYPDMEMISLLSERNFLDPLPNIQFLSSLAPEQILVTTL